MAWGGRWRWWKGWWGSEMGCLVAAVLLPFGLGQVAGRMVASQIDEVTGLDPPQAGGGVVAGRGEARCPLGWHRVVSVSSLLW